MAEGLGFCPSLLLNINDIAEGNAPGRKLHVAGFLASLFCCQNSSVSPLNDQFEGAHKRGLTVSYRRRPLVSDVMDEDNCEIDRIPSKLEWNVPTLNFKKHSFFLDDATIQRYCRESSNVRSTGQPPTGVMQEIYENIVETAAVIMKAMNQDLVAEMATEFGENVTTGSSTGKVINFSRDGDKMILDNGIVEILRDFQENELCADPCIIGGGLFASWNIAQVAACCNAAGFDLSRLGLPKFFFDKDTQSIWGQDTIGVLSPGSVKFIGRNKYTGAFAGQRGNSFFTTLPLPVDAYQCNADDCLRDLVFDMQLRYIDCPTEIDVAGVPTTVNRGWQVILSKEYALWVQPTDAYADGDELAGTNGTLKYFIGNESDSAGAYAYTF